MQRLFLMVVLVLGSSMGFVVACDGTAIQRENPESGNFERVCPVWDGHDYEIHWFEKVSGVWSEGTQLTDNSVDDVAPYLAFDSVGSTGVVWRVSGAETRIQYIGRKSIGDAWNWQSVAVAVSDGIRDASAPWLVFHDDTPWVGWHEFPTGGGIHVMGGGGDGAEPWPVGFTPGFIGSTLFDGNIELEIRSAPSDLWIVWVHSSTHLGYSEWDATTDSWGSVLYEAYSGASDLLPAKQRVEEHVTN